jgi:YVTN family beta-propeller protein
MDDEGNQVFVLSDGEPSREKEKDVPGVLWVIRGAEIATRIGVGEDPLFLRVSPDRERLYVASEQALSVIDLPALSKLGDAAPKPGGRSPLTGRAKELTVSSDGKRGYVLYDESSKLGILDLEKHQLVAELGTGRGGVKFGKFLGAMALSAASMGAAQYQAGYAGIGYYSVYTVAPANTALLLSGDEKHVYVLNTRSNDVTVVDTGTLLAVTKVGVGGAANRMELLPGGALVAVTTGEDTLHLIDTKTHQQISELPDGGNYLFSPDERFAAAIGKQVVYCLEGKTLRTLGKATGFKRPTQLLFEPPALEGGSKSVPELP